MTISKKDKVLDLSKTIRSSLEIPSWIKSEEDYVRFCLHLQAKLCEERMICDYIINWFKSSHPKEFEKFSNWDFPDFQCEVALAHDLATGIQLDINRIDLEDPFSPIDD